MIMSDPKKVASVILSRKYSGNAVKEGGAAGAAAMQGGPEPESDASAAKTDAARMVLSAIEAKDAGKLATAIETLVSLCDDDSDDSGESEEAE